MFFSALLHPHLIVLKMRIATLLVWLGQVSFNIVLFEKCMHADHFLSISGDLLADISRSPSQHTRVGRLTNECVTLAFPVRFPFGTMLRWRTSLIVRYLYVNRDSSLHKLLYSEKHLHLAMPQPQAYAQTVDDFHCSPYRFSFQTNWICSTMHTRSDIKPINATFVAN